MGEKEVVTRAYREGAEAASGFPLAEVSDHLQRPGTIVWVDLCRPSAHQLHELAGELDLHELAVEDALGRHQRPKVDHYESHLFVSTHAVHVDREDASLVETEIDAFIGARWLITVRKDDGFDIHRVVERCNRSPDLAAHGVSFLLYALLDVVVDDYFEVISALDDYYEEVSESIFSEQPLDAPKARHWFEMRRAMVRFHRLVVPMREAVSALMRREHAAVPDELYPYFQDVYDHILRVSEATDSLRDLVSTIVETNLSLRDYRQNQVVKRVSSWAAIIAVPALVTGYYGMNVPYPGSGESWGVLVSTALMAALSLGLYRVFRKRDWL